jgi:hypothetical protein
MESKDDGNEGCGDKSSQKGTCDDGQKELGSLPSRLISLFHSSMTTRVHDFCKEHCEIFPLDGDEEHHTECMQCFRKFEQLLEEVLEPLYEERGLASLFEEVKELAVADSQMERIVEMVLAAAEYKAFAALMRSTKLAIMGAAVPLPSSDEDDGDWNEGKHDQ